jgi:RNA polymerase sigma-70 factor, ECF subfamily
MMDDPGGDATRQDCCPTASGRLGREDERAVSSSPSPLPGSAGEDPAAQLVAPLGGEGAAPREDPDRDLVERASAGDRRAFDALLRRHYDRVHRVAWRLTGSHADAQDIAQDVCCTLVEKIGTFRGQSRFSTWLMGVAINACRDHGRRRGAWTRAKDGLSVLARIAHQPDGRDLYRQTWLASELARLDPLLRETVVLVIGEDMTHAEAARALGVAESTVSWRLHEARRQLSTDQE